MKTLITALFIILFLSIGVAAADSTIYIVKKDGEIWFTNVPCGTCVMIGTAVPDQEPSSESKFDLEDFLYTYYSNMEHNARVMRDPIKARKAKEYFDLLLLKEKLRKGK